MSSRTIGKILAATAGWLLATMPALAQPASTQAERTIESIRGDLYRAREGTHTTVFLATSDGILLADPLNAEVARWLKSELDARFPGRAVRYVIYTGLDYDRLGGAGTFAATAQIIATAGFDEQLSESRARLPQRLATLDRNATGVLEQNELTGLPDAAALRQRDRNNDGSTTANEVWSDVLPPEGSYGKRRQISLGSHTIELIVTGGMIAPAATAVYFSNERTIFSHEYPPLTSPFSNTLVRPRDVVVWSEAIRSADFDTLVAGDGGTVSSADVDRLRDYVDAVIASVAAGYDRGWSLAQMQQASSLAFFSATPFAANRDADVARVFRQARVLALDLTAAPTISRVSMAGFSLCDGTAADVRVGAGLSVRLFRQLK